MFSMLLLLLLLQILDLEAFAIQAQCPVAGPPTAEQLAEAAAAANSGPARINGNGSGLSSRHGAVNMIWLDFLGGNITNTREPQLRSCCHGYSGAVAILRELAVVKLS
jgi:hypothetical protein